MTTTTSRKALKHPFRGVSWDALYGCWTATITVNGKRLWLGSFDQPEEAARVYEAAALQYRGGRARQ
ncbi:AP2 domain-containing protein [Xanthobacter sp. V2C-8]|uniref:AP2 domain-containing protein n=1 Tax=Xanthobacter albus TaxID=3119929 RepID=UPI003727AC78